MPSISIIAALSENFAIGKNNQLLCHIPGDLKRFKSITSGHTVIMGRNTLNSLPNGPLPNRQNIVITHHPETLPDGCIPAASFDDALKLCSSDGSEVFVIGGGQIYTQAFPYATKFYLTLIHSSFPDADAFFPEFDYSAFCEVFREDHAASDLCPYDFSFIDLVRKA